MDKRTLTTCLLLGLFGGFLGSILGAAGDAEFNNLTLNGDVSLVDTVWDDLRSPTTALKIGALTPPDFEKVYDDAAGTSVGVYAYCFDDSASEYLHGEGQLSHRYKDGTNLGYHIHAFTTTGNAGNVVIGFDYNVADIGSNFASDSTLTETTVAVAGTAHLHQYLDIADIDGTGLGGSSALMFTMYRKGGDAADTLSGDLCISFYDMHFEADKLGSDDETPL